MCGPTSINFFRTNNEKSPMGKNFNLENTIFHKNTTPHTVDNLMEKRIK